MVNIQGPDKIKIAKDKKVTLFMGGTCNESLWRDDLIKLLDDTKVSWFNPVVEDWTPECQEEEKRQRKSSDYVLYVITTKMIGVYSIAEVIDDSNKRPDKTIFCYLKKDGDDKFNKAQKKSLESVKDMVKDNKGEVFDSLKDIADYLNNGKKE